MVATEQTIQLALTLLNLLEQAKAINKRALVERGGRRTPQEVAEILRLTTRIAEINKQIISLVGVRGRIESIEVAGRRLRRGTTILPPPPPLMRRSGKTVAGIPIEDIARIEVRT